MKVVIDTNVFISGIFWSGPPYTILKAWRDEKIQLVLSEDILKEFNRVAAKLSEKYPGINLNYWIDLITISGLFINIPENMQGPICDDPDDDKFLHCADTAGVKTVVSGDKHLLNVTGYKGIEIITPKQFVNKYLR